MEKETSAYVSIHMEGPSHYCCDQYGDCATITLGKGNDASLTANAQDFLILAEVCKEAATRIAMKSKTEEEAPA